MFPKPQPQQKKGCWGRRIRDGKRAGAEMYQRRDPNGGRNQVFAQWGEKGDRDV